MTSHQDFSTTDAMSSSSEDFGVDEDSDSKLGVPPQSDPGFLMASSPNEAQLAFFDTFSCRLNDDIEIFDAEDFFELMNDRVEEEEEEDEEVGSPRAFMKRQMQELDIYSTIDEESQEEYPSSTTSGMTTEDESAVGQGSQRYPSSEDVSFQRQREVRPLASSDSGSRSDVESLEDFSSDEAMGDIFAKEQASTRPSTPWNPKRTSEGEIEIVDRSASVPFNGVNHTFDLEFTVTENEASLLENNSKAGHASKHSQQSVHFDESSFTFGGEGDEVFESEDQDSQPVRRTPDATESKNPRRTLFKTKSAGSSSSLDTVRRKSSLELLDYDDPGCRNPSTGANTPRDIMSPPARPILRNGSCENLIEASSPQNPLQKSDVRELEAQTVDQGRANLSSDEGSTNKGSAYEADREDNAAAEPSKKHKKKKRKRTLKDEDRLEIHELLQSIKSKMADAQSSESPSNSDCDETKFITTSSGLPPDGVLQTPSHPEVDPNDRVAPRVDQESEAHGHFNLEDIPMRMDSVSLWLERNFNSDGESLQRDDRTGHRRRRRGRNRRHLSLPSNRKLNLEGEVDPDLRTLKRSPKISGTHFDFGDEKLIELELKTSMDEHELSRSHTDMQKVTFDQLDEQEVLPMATSSLVIAPRLLCTSTQQVSKQIEIDLEIPEKRQRWDLNNNAVKHISRVIASNTAGSQKSSQNSMSSEYISLVHIDNINHILPDSESSNKEEEDHSRGRVSERCASTSFVAPGDPARVTDGNSGSFQGVCSPPSKNPAAEDVTSSTVLQGQKRSMSDLEIDSGQDDRVEQLDNMPVENSGSKESFETRQAETEAYQPVSFTFDIPELKTEKEAEVSQSDTIRMSQTSQQPVPFKPYILDTAVLQQKLQDLARSRVENFATKKLYQEPPRQTPLRVQETVNERTELSQFAPDETQHRTNQGKEPTASVVKKGGLVKSKSQELAPQTNVNPKQRSTRKSFGSQGISPFSRLKKFWENRDTGSGEADGRALKDSEAKRPLPRYSPKISPLRKSESDLLSLSDRSTSKHSAHRTSSGTGKQMMEQMPSQTITTVSLSPEAQPSGWESVREFDVSEDLASDDVLFLGVSGGQDGRFEQTNIMPREYNSTKDFFEHSKGETDEYQPVAFTFDIPELKIDVRNLSHPTRMTMTRFSRSLDDVLDTFDSRDSSRERDCRTDDNPDASSRTESNPENELRQSRGDLDMVPCVSHIATVSTIENTNTTKSMLKEPDKLETTRKLRVEQNKRNTAEHAIQVVSMDVHKSREERTDEFHNFPDSNTVSTNDTQQQNNLSEDTEEQEHARKHMVVEPNKLNASELGILVLSTDIQKSTEEHNQVNNNFVEAITVSTNNNTWQNTPKRIQKQENTRKLVVEQNKRRTTMQETQVLSSDTHTKEIQNFHEANAVSRSTRRSSNETERQDHTRLALERDTRNAAEHGIQVLSTDVHDNAVVQDISVSFLTFPSLTEIGKDRELHQESNDRHTEEMRNFVETNVDFLKPLVSQQAECSSDSESYATAEDEDNDEPSEQEPLQLNWKRCSCSVPYVKPQGPSANPTESQNHIPRSDRTTAEIAPQHICNTQPLNLMLVSTPHIGNLVQASKNDDSSWSLHQVDSSVIQKRPALQDVQVEVPQPTQRSQHNKHNERQKSGNPKPSSSVKSGAHAPFGQVVLRKTGRLEREFGSRIGAKNLLFGAEAKSQSEKKVGPFKSSERLNQASQERNDSDSKRAVGRNDVTQNTKASTGSIRVKNQDKDSFETGASGVIARYDTRNGIVVKPESFVKTQHKRGIKRTGVFSG